MKKAYFCIGLLCIALLSCVTNKAALKEDLTSACGMDASLPSIEYEGHMLGDSCGASLFAEESAVLKLGDFLQSAGGGSEAKYVLRIKAEGAGLRVKSTNNFDAFMGPMMGALGSSFILAYIGGDLENGPVALTGAGLSLTGAVLAILAIMPDKTTASFDGTFTVAVVNAKTKEVKYEETFTVDSTEKKFTGNYEKNQKCVNAVSEYYGSLITSGIMKIINKAF